MGFVDCLSFAKESSTSQVQSSYESLLSRISTGGTKGPGCNFASLNLTSQAIVLACSTFFYFTSIETS